MVSHRREFTVKTIYKTSEETGYLEEVSEYCDGNWVNLISPTAEEVKDVIYKNLLNKILPRRNKLHQKTENHTEN